jgi:peptidoglycan/xylan/chitin deacetylase (PgdA/CDA1 family)
MRFLKKVLAVIFVIAVLLSLFYALWLSPRYVVPILMYHRFGYEKSTLFVTPGNFDRQMSYLKKNGYNVISLDELVRGIKAKRKFKHNTVVITMDDGYEDNYTYAYPVLKKYNFPATIFIASDLIKKDKDFMVWDQVRSMLKDSISFGAHTRNHVYLPSINNEKILWDEIAGPREVIMEKTGFPAWYFCYPTGGFTEKIKGMVEKAGYKAACTTNRGFAKLNKDLYELKRVKVTNSDCNKPFSFWAKLSGYYNLLRSIKRGY